MLLTLSSQEVTTCTTCFNILNSAFYPTEYISVFHTVLRVKSNCSLITVLNSWTSQWRCNVFPLIYSLAQIVIHPHFNEARKLASHSE